MLSDLPFCLSEKEEYNSLFSGGKDCYTSFSQTFSLKLSKKVLNLNLET